MSPALRIAPVLMLVLAQACTTGGVDTDATDPGTTGGGGSTTGVWAEAPAPADLCDDALLVSHGLYVGNLRDAKPDPATAGVCGGGGPDTFLRVELPVRADLHVRARGNGFTPRLSLAPDDCLGGREIACAVDAPIALRDLAGGTVVRVSVGVEQHVFVDMNKSPAPEGAPDPLAFELDIGLTRVLGPGDVCEPASRGRCSDGSLCLAADDRGAVPVCTTLPADTCSTAQPVTLVLDLDGRGSLDIDPAVAQTDAHHHSCGGDGTRERVMRLHLPAAPPARALEIAASRPDIGLAVRAPSCLLADEVTCAPGTEAAARVVISNLPALRAAGIEPYLFIELPAGSELDLPFTLDLRLVPEPATWGTPGAAGE